MTPDPLDSAALLALVARVRETKHAMESAQHVRDAANDALKAADHVSCLAANAFLKAQNDLVVAAGGIDRSFIWNLDDYIARRTAQEPQ